VEEVMKETITVNEIFGPTMQGEGKSVGKKVMFLRLAHCNLSCHWCDTPYTWNWTGTAFSHPEKFDFQKEAREMSPADIYLRLRELMATAPAGAIDEPALVISGGEPLLQQNRLLPLLRILKAAGWWIEIETNGTITTLIEVDTLVDQINCSPKLSNSGDDLPARIRRSTLNALSRNAKCNFKFVIGSPKDYLEAVAVIMKFKLMDVYLMPLGRTEEQLASTGPLVESLARTGGYRYSPRRHIELFGDKRGL
jgi:7-carboxy-7-deazaguanine synthase